MEISRMDKTVFRAYNMVKDGNIDYQYWFNKTHNEKLQAAAVTIAVAFGEPEFLTKKIDRTVFSARKHKWMNIFNQDFRDFIECFNRNEVEYILVGGYAVILRGYSRSTGDMDICF